MKHNRKKAEELIKEIGKILFFRSGSPIDLVEQALNEIEDRTCSDLTTVIRGKDRIIERQDSEIFTLKQMIEKMEKGDAKGK